MRRIDTSAVIPVIRQLCIEACQQLSSNVTDALRDARAREESPLCQEILDMLLENAAFASENHLACCQDTGMTVVLLEIGQEVCWEGMPLYDAVNEGVRQGYRDGYLRKSVVDDPLLRKNTGDNTPAMIHVDIVPGDKVTITILPKGAGSENMSALYMLTPADGVQGVKKAVLEAVERAGGKPCPPIVVGIGLGGTMDKAAFLSKKALLREIGARNPKPHLAALEQELLEEINKTGIGALGMGGTVTALDVHIEAFSTHIACLPLAINLQCHAYRHACAII